MSGRSGCSSRIVIRPPTRTCRLAWWKTPASTQKRCGLAFWSPGTLDQVKALGKLYNDLEFNKNTGWLEYVERWSTHNQWHRRQSSAKKPPRVPPPGIEIQTQAEPCCGRQRDRGGWPCQRIGWEGTHMTVLKGLKGIRLSEALRVITLYGLLRKRGTTKFLVQGLSTNPRDVCSNPDVREIDACMTAITEYHCDNRPIRAFFLEQP